MQKEIPRLPIYGEIRVATPILWQQRGGVPFGFILSFLYKYSTYSSKNQYKKWHFQSVIWCCEHDIVIVLPLLYWHGKEGCLTDDFITFFLSVMASIVAYYICKWLDNED